MFKLHSNHINTLFSLVFRLQIYTQEKALGFNFSLRPWNNFTIKKTWTACHNMLIRYSKKPFNYSNSHRPVPFNWKYTFCTANVISWKLWIRHFFFNLIFSLSPKNNHQLFSQCTTDDCCHGSNHTDRFATFIL